MLVPRAVPAAPLRYLYASGWLDGRKDQAVVLLRQGDPPALAVRGDDGAPGNTTLVERLARMHVTVAQAAGAVVRGASDAC